MINCRPHYLASVASGYFVAVYIPQSKAGTKIYLNELYSTISKQEAALIVVGDFNAGTLKSILPNLNQHVKFATRGEKTHTKNWTTYTPHTETHTKLSLHLANLTIILSS